MTVEYEDLLYEVDGPVAIVTINRPTRLNAFRAKTIEELIHAFKRAWADDGVRAIVLQSMNWPKRGSRVS